MEASDQSGAQPPEETDEQRKEREAAEQERQAAEDAATPGEQGEQVPAEQDAPTSRPPLDQSTPVATSAPDPARQSGVPLQQDRDAGVQPGPVQPGNEGEGERPEGADPTSPSAASPAE